MRDIALQFLVFGLDSTASLAEVKAARHLYIKAFHPDRFPKDSEDQKKAEEKQKSINLAYEHISAWFNSGGQTNHKAKPKDRFPKSKDLHEELAEYMEYLSNSERSFRTLQNIFCDLRSFCYFIEGQGIKGGLDGSVTNLVVKYAGILLERGYQPATIGRHLFSIRGWFIFCKLDAAFILDLTAKYKPKTTNRPKGLKESQVTKLLASVKKHAKKEERLLIEFLLYTGLTAGEIGLLSWGDISKAKALGSRQNCIVLQVGGRSGYRDIPLGEKAEAVLVELGMKDILATKSANNPLYGSAIFGLTPKMVHYAVTQGGDAAGVPVTPSLLRNTFAFRLVSSDVSKQHLAEYMGISEQSASVYYPITQVHLKDLIKLSQKA